jgi:serine/threonine protein kinase
LAVPSQGDEGDLYALGVTLYQMLTGSLPFTAADPTNVGTDRSQLATMAHAPPASAGSRRPGLPRFLTS